MLGMVEAYREHHPEISEYLETLMKGLVEFQEAILSLETSI